MSSICVSCGLIMLSRPRKAIHNRGRPKPSGPIRARQRWQSSSELRIAGISCGRPKVGVSVIGPTVSRFSTARHPTNYAVPRICGYLSRLSAVHSWCGWPQAVPTLLTLHSVHAVYSVGVPHSVGCWQAADESHGRSPGAVHSLLTLYMACTPCTAWASHAAWDVGRLPMSCDQPSRRRQLVRLATSIHWC
jgi:hypothetical protein